MKKIIVSAFFVILFAVSAVAQRFMYDDLYYVILDSSDRTCQVGPNTQATGDVTIHGEVYYCGESYKVCGISKEAFNGSSITSVSMPNSEYFTYIDCNAFINCRYLRSVTVPNYVTRLGEMKFEQGGVFAFCSSLRKLIIGKRVSEIGPDIFTGLNNLEKVVCLNPIPPKVYDWGATRTSAPIYVPDQSVAAYQEADVWRKNNIRRISSM